MKDSLKRWYKQGFDNLNIIVPMSIWKTIQDHISKWPANWYKNNAKEIEFEIPKNAWEDISKKLVVINQGKQSSSRILFKASAIALCFFLIPLTTHNYTFEQRSIAEFELKPHNNEIQIADNKSYTDSKQTEINSSTDKAEKHTSELSQHKNLNQLELQLKQPLLTTSERTEHPNNLVSGNESPLNLTHVSSLKHRELSVLNTAELNLIPEQKTYKKIATPFRSKWMIGAGVSSNSTSLITPLINQTFSSESALKGKMMHNISFGLASIYTINSRSSVAIDLMFNDKKSFSIFDLSNSNALRRNTEFNFITASGLYKRSLFNSNRVEQQQLNAGIGLFSSIRTSIDEHSDYTDYLSFIDNYKKYDIGLSLGVDYSFDITKHIRLFTGLKYHLGVINLFNGADKVPTSSFNTRTSVLGFNVSAFYKL